MPMLSYVSLVFCVELLVSDWVYKYKEKIQCYTLVSVA